MSVLFNILIAVVTFLFMEFMAWFSHKYIMHGFLWSWHRSHHRPRHGIFEKNDLFAVVFSIPAILLIYFGFDGFTVPFWIGLGITAYGGAYMIFHDIIVHRRVKMNFKTDSRYMKRLIRAHKIHHKHTEKEGAEAFGFLFAPRKYAPK